MKKYLVSMLWCGDVNSTRFVINAKDDDDAIKLTYLYMHGYETKADYDA